MTEPWGKMSSDAAQRAWIASRPLCVRKLAAEFPFGTPVPKALTISQGVEQYYVLGYDESDHLIITYPDPAKNYDAAMEKRVRLCAQHVREHR